jgi:Holliday junction resolvase
VKTRQQRAHRRGYNFENELVNNFRNFGWHAKRLGGSSIYIPDIIATRRYNRKFDYCIALEAKSTGRDRVEIPGKEFWRCVDWFDMFPMYDEYPIRSKYVVLSYKFFSTRASGIKQDGAKRRQPKEYHHILKISNDPNTVMARSFISRIKDAYCNYNNGPRLVFKDNEGDQYVQAMDKSKILKTVTNFKDVIDTILFEC